MGRFGAVTLFVLVLLSIGNGGSSCDHTALGRHTRLVLCAFNKLRASMRKFRRFEHRAQTRAVAGITKRRERDDNHRNNNCNRHIMVPASRIKSTTAGSTAANVAKRSIVLEL